MYCDTYFDVLNSSRSLGGTDGQSQFPVGFLRRIPIAIRLDGGALADRHAYRRTGVGRAGDAIQDREQAGRTRYH